MRVFGFAGWSGSGKTTLIERLIPELVSKRLTVSLIKHAHHDFDIDQEGKDSWRHKRAGAHTVIVTTKGSLAMFTDVDEDVQVEELRQRYVSTGTDLITLFIGLELMALCFYIMVGFLRGERRSNEAAIKYLILGGTATATLLMGVSLLCGGSGSFALSVFTDALRSQDAVATIEKLFADSPRELGQLARQRLLAEKIDVTRWMVDYFESNFGSGPHR